jgi:hypothetical protein
MTAAADTCELCGREIADERHDEPRLCADCLEQVMVASLLEDV